MFTRMGRNEDKRNRIIRSICLSLIEHGYAFTTKARAKSSQRVIEKLVTKVKEGTLHSMRLANRLFNNMEVINKLKSRVENIANRDGGYTSLKRYSVRKGDNAILFLLRFINV